MGVQLKHELSTVAIRCPHCGHAGSALWETNATLTPSGPKSALVNLEGFYERLASKPPHNIELVCHHCGHVQPG